MRLDYVISGFLIHNGKVLLIYHKILNKWLPPGGHIEKNETPDEAVNREFEEELKLEIEILGENSIPKCGSMVKQLTVPFYVNVHNVGDHNHCCFFYLLKMEDGRKIIVNIPRLQYIL